MSWFINSYLWTIFVLLHFFAISFFSFKANQTQLLKHSLYGYALSIIPWWVLIAKYSKTLPIAGFVYDFIVTLSWLFCVILFEHKTFSIQSYIGLAMVAGGILILKKG